MYGSPEHVSMLLALGSIRPLYGLKFLGPAYCPSSTA